MVDFLKNPTVQAVGTFIGAVLAVVSLVVATIIYYRTRQKKSLSYEVISKYPLISVNDEIKGRLKILLDDNPVEDIQLIIIKLMNDGNVAVSASDYEKPITLDFGQRTNIISADIVESSPTNMNPVIKKSSKSISVNPVLINPSEFFTLKMFVSQYDNTLIVDDRIAGVRVHPLKKISISRLTIAFIVAIITLSLGTAIINVLSYSRRIPEVSDISIEPKLLHPGEQATVSVNISGPYDTISWTALIGKFQSDNSSPSVVYTLCNQIHHPGLTLHYSLDN